MVDTLNFSRRSDLLFLRCGVVGDKHIEALLRNGGGWYGEMETRRWAVAIVYVLCLVSAALAVGWHGHARATCGSDRGWSGWTAVAFGTPAAVLFAVVVAVG